MSNVNVKATTTVEYKPWMAPNYLGRVVGDNDETESSHVSRVDQVVLDAMAERWLEDLYKKANKTNPWMRKVYR